METAYLIANRCCSQNKVLAEQKAPLEEPRRLEHQWPSADRARVPLAERRRRPLYRLKNRDTGADIDPRSWQVAFMPDVRALTIWLNLWQQAAINISVRGLKRLRGNFNPVALI
jgi:hypothetical protein